MDCFVPRSDAKRVRFSDAKIYRKNACQEAKGAQRGDVPTFLECPYCSFLKINNITIVAKRACPYFFCRKSRPKAMMGRLFEVFLWQQLPLELDVFAVGVEEIVL